MVGDRAELEVLQLEFDDRNEDHLADHDVRRADVLNVLNNVPRFFNLPGRTASHVMIGPDGSGQFFYIALVETPVQGLWRPSPAGSWVAAHQSSTTKEHRNDDL